MPFSHPDFYVQLSKPPPPVSSDSSRVTLLTREVCPVDPVSAEAPAAPHPFSPLGWSPQAPWQSQSDPKVDQPHRADKPCTNISVQRSVSDFT